MEIGILETGTVKYSVNTNRHMYNGELGVNFQPFVNCALCNRPIIDKNSIHNVHISMFNFHVSGSIDI